MKPEEKISFRRKQESARRLLSFKLGLTLDHMARDIISGDISKLGQFQQLIQYAPEEMKMLLLNKIDNKKF